MANGERANASHGYVASQDVKLREYLEVLIRNLELRTTDQFEAQEKALRVAAEGLNKKLESMNEFRKSLDDQSHTFLTKNEYQIQHIALCNDVDRLTQAIKSLELSRAELSGKANQSQVTLVMSLSVLSLFLSIVSVILRMLGM